MLALVQALLAKAPPGSMFVVEADSRFDFRQLPHPDAWAIRDYFPAVIGIMTTTAERD